MSSICDGSMFYYLIFKIFYLQEIGTSFIVQPRTHPVDVISTPCSQYCILRFIQYSAIFLLLHKIIQPWRVHNQGGICQILTRGFRIWTMKRIQCETVCMYGYYRPPKAVFDHIGRVSHFLQTEVEPPDPPDKYSPVHNMAICRGRESGSSAFCTKWLTLLNEIKMSAGVDRGFDYNYRCWLWTVNSLC